MPVLANPKHEHVAQLAAQGIDQTHAYMTVYPNSSEESARRAASALLTKLDVRARVQELSEKAAEQAVVTAEMVLARAWEVANSDAKDRAAHLSIAARAFTRFKDAAPEIDARSITVNFPDSTSPEEKRAMLKALRGESGG